LIDAKGRWVTTGPFSFLRVAHHRTSIALRSDHRSRINVARVGEGVLHRCIALSQKGDDGSLGTRSGGENDPKRPVSPRVADSGSEGGFETDARFFRRDDPSTRFPSADAPSHDRFSDMR
jgi:hypothetical protein